MPTNKPDYWSKNNWANYKKYHWTEKAKKERSLRTIARYHMEKIWKIRKWDKEHEVQHIHRVSKWNWKDNLSIVTRKFNRVQWAKYATRAYYKNKLKNRITKK